MHDILVERNPDRTGRREAAPRREFAKSEAVREKEAAERLDEIHQYLRDLYASRDVVTRTNTPSGQTLDWVPAESQAPDGRVADPPDENRPLERLEGIHVAEHVRFELEAEGVETGPPGTVPLVRKQIEQIHPAGTLQDWLAKGVEAKKLTAPDDPQGGLQEARRENPHKYAHAAQVVRCYGTEGFINLWWPYVEWSDEFSLGQQWMARGFESGLQTVEVGAQTYRDLYGDWKPHLMLYYTTNGYTHCGDHLGGYNTDVLGWVQYATNIVPGQLLGPLSTFGGDQYEMGVKVQLYQGNWWVRIGSTWMGYYPASLFNSGGLASQSDVVDWGGEIVDTPRVPATTATDMGSGHWPAEGWQWCGYMRGLHYQSDTGGGMSRMRGTPSVTHPMCYDLAADFGNTGSWGPYFWWGGSGRNALCP
ncbi:neprosin family prolyl endopeptidase [Actinomadura sp. 9N215]|uniref:neprosin family prolyl endopeptidase n=1 Tax=Actinomadura sp. 9N215 TaxID=3375150 RepID=UPI0037A5D951